MRRANARAVLLGALLVTGACATPPPPPPPPQPVVPPHPAPAPLPPPPKQPDRPPADATFLDAGKGFDVRVADLIGRMTLDEKISQMIDKAVAIPRLGVPEYGWWNEALHGVARAGVATVFPQAIALAATWDDGLMLRVATATSDEARAKYHQFLREGKHGRYQGLTFFSPNINIFRDPRWGRGHETYGEDPFLTARMGVAFIKGMQGEHPKYLKTLATAKHYAVHSGPEKDRHAFDARVSKRDLYDTYLPHFEAVVRETKVGSFMSAYNAIDGKPASANDTLLDEILRKRWGFGGYVVTDCGAVRDIWRNHKKVETAEQAAAAAVKAGTDIECGSEFKNLGKAVKQGLITESEIDRAVTRLFLARFRLGMFDPPDMVPWSKIPYARNDAPEHRDLARQAAREAMVLLENRGGLLPIKPSVKKLAVIGPTADSADVLLGNYNGTPSQQVTILDGVKAEVAARGLQFSYAQGSPVMQADDSKIAEAVATAKWADLVVLVLGLTPREEGEEGENKLNPSGDRKDIGLPAIQDKLMRAVVAAGKPVVLVLTGGSNLGIPWAKAKLPAILMTWYSGEEGGAAVAEVLFGKASPAGRLPVTFYASAEQLPDFSDYSLKNRTYRYFTGEPLWAFGHGMSYATLKYSGLKIVPARLQPGQTAYVSVDVHNTSKVDSDEVVQLYVSDDKASVPVPVRSLAGFRRVPVAAGTHKVVTFTLTPRQLSIVNEDGQRIVEAGRFTVAVGGGQPGKNHKYASAANGVTGSVEVTGSTQTLP